MEILDRPVKRARLGVVRRVRSIFRRRPMVIDCNTPVFWLAGRELRPERQLRNRTVGLEEFFPDDIRFFKTQVQQQTAPVKGVDVIPSIHMHTVLSAHFGVVFRSDPSLYPKRLLGLDVCLWGTFFRHAQNGHLSIYYMRKNFEFGPVELDVIDLEEPFQRDDVTAYLRERV